MHADLLSCHDPNTGRPPTERGPHFFVPARTHSKGDAPDGLNRGSASHSVHNFSTAAPLTERAAEPREMQVSARRNGVPGTPESLKMFQPGVIFLLPAGCPAGATGHLPASAPAPGGSRLTSNSSHDGCGLQASHRRPPGAGRGPSDPGRVVKQELFLGLLLVMLNRAAMGSPFL